MLWIVQDIITQYVIGIALCTLFFAIWKVTHKNEKL